ELNEPFEFTPCTRGQLSRQKLKTMNDKAAQREIFEKLRSENPGLKWRTFRTQFKERDRKDFVAKIKSRQKDYADYFRVNYLPELSRVFGLVCLSKLNDQILMWSHYAASHTGVVLGLDGEHAFFKDCHVVRYSSERLLYD